MLFDHAMVPTLYHDWSHYLWTPRLREKVLLPAEEETTRKNRDWIDRLGKKDVIPNILMMDRRLGICFPVDFLIREKDGKYRIHLSGYRLSQYADDPDWGCMLARMMLATVKKIRMASWIHTDAIRIDGRSFYGSEDRRNRREDIKNIHRTRAILNGLGFLRVEESNGRLHPNLKAKYTPFFALEPEAEYRKQTTAQSVHDPSMIWQCGNKRRNRLRCADIYRWDDPRFLPALSGMMPSKYQQIIEKMIHLNERDDDTIIDVPSSLTERFHFLCENETRPWCFVDFETDYDKCIYLCGYFSEEGGYRMEWGDDISLPSERALMQRIDDRLRKFQEDGGRVAYFYAEKSFWKERCRVQGLTHLDNLFDDAIDLHTIFVEGPVLIRGLFDFKLKHIAAALYRHGLITIRQPSGCADGEESIRLAQQYFRTHDPVIRSVLEQYNRFDCEILHALLHVLRRHVH